MITVTWEKDGIVFSKSKRSERSGIEKIYAKAEISRAKRLKQFDFNTAKQQLKKELVAFDRLESVLSSFGALGEQALELLYDINDTHNEELNEFLFSVEFPSSNKQKIVVPNILKPFVELHDNTYGRAVGKGEILACILFKDVTGKPNAAYDIFDGLDPWHMKDHRNSNATHVGRASSKKDLSEASKFDWKQADVLHFCWNELDKQYPSRNKNRNFGTTEIQGNDAINVEIKKKYNTDDLLHAAHCLENDLNEVAAKSLKDAKGILFLKSENDVTYFERVDAFDVCFYAISSDNVKITDIRGRYVDAIMSSVNEAAKLEQKRIALETEKAEKLLEFRRFESSWNSVTTIAELSLMLNKKPDALKRMKEKILRDYPDQFKFNKHDRSKRKRKK